MRIAWKMAPWGHRAAVAVLVSLLALLGLAGCQVQSSGQWQVLGPNDNSVVLTVLRDPTVPQLVYAGTSGGQVDRTRIEATTVQAGTGIPAHATVPTLVADPRLGGTLFAGTSSGIYVTRDYGDTWQARGKGLPADDEVAALALVPGSGAAATLYAGTQQHGVYTSTDSGTTWTADSSGLPAGANVYDLTYDSATSTLYATLVGGAGIFALPPGATGWVGRASGLPPKSDVFTVLALGPAPGAGPSQPLYAGTSKGLFASADGGQTWHAAGLSTSRVLALAADPTQAGAFYAGTDANVYHTADGGQQWAPLPSGISHPVAAIVVLVDTNHHPVVFAASGTSILRYPPRAGSTTGVAETVVALIVALFLLIVLYYYSRRNLRYLRAHVPNRPTGGTPPPGGSATPVASHAKHNGNVPLDPPGRPGANRARRGP